MDAIDLYIDTLLDKKYLSEEQVESLLDTVSEILVRENNVVTLSTPCSLVGDIHGQFCDMLELFRIGGKPGEETKYVFMGDYVDRGQYSVETISLLLAYKVKYPDRVFLLRGNHETESVTQFYGFLDNCIQYYGSNRVWKLFLDVFNLLPLAAVIDQKYFCVHGGLSPNMNLIGQIRNIERAYTSPDKGVLSDLIWSDPDENAEKFFRSPRGNGFLFGKKITNNFCKINAIDLIARSHQTVMEGYKYWFGEEQLVTVWSAPNFLYRIKNKASVMEIDPDGTRRFKIFDGVPREKRDGPSKLPLPLFL